MTARYVADLSPRQRRAAFEHTFASWAEGRDLEQHVAYQEEQLERATPALLGYAGLVDPDGELLASHKRFALELEVRGATVPTIGIGAVMVPASRRLRGLGHALVRRALEEAARSGARLAWLFSEIDPTYYQRLGFVSVDWPILAAAVDALPDETPLSMVAAPIGEELALAAELDAARRSAGGIVVAPVRRAAVRAYFAWRNGVERVWLARDGDPVAYLEITRGGPPGELAVLEIAEWGARGVTRADLLGAMKKVAVLRGAAFVAGPLGPELARAPFVPFASDAHGVPMLCALDPSLSLPVGPDGSLSASSARFGLTDYF